MRFPPPQKKKSNKDRISYVDVSKGIAIWLMIVGHMYISEQMVVYIYSFHMPLFFLLSGMFFRINKSFFDNLESAVRGLLIPYFFFSLLNLTICWISPYLHPELYYGMKGADIFIAALNGILIGADRVTRSSFLPLNPLWFLVALFVVRILCSTISSITNNKYYWAGLTILISFLLFCITTTDVYSFRSAMLATPFYVIGFLICKIDFSKIRFFVSFPFFLLLVSYFIFIIPKNGLCDLNGGVYGNCIAVYFINALVGSIIVLLLSTYVSRIDKFLEVVGRNTLVILGLHAFFVRLMQVVSVFLFGSESMYSSLFIIIVPIIAILCCIIISDPIYRYIPLAVGRKKHI